MFVFSYDPNISKVEFYKILECQVKSVIEGQRNWITNLANVSSLIYNGLNSVNVFAREKPINWAGFYLTDRRNPNTLFLGPFQGKVACTMIKYGRGVCGTAAVTKRSQVVKNVNEFPGHIACDSETNSEIVVPLLFSNNFANNTNAEASTSLQDEIIGVLDIDSLSKGTFDEVDKVALELICEVLVHGSDWSNL